MRSGTGLLFGLTILAASPPRPLVAQSRWRTEDRAVFGEMLRITAIASSFERLYVVGETQLLYRDLGRSTWEGPFAAPAAGELLGARGAVVDPLDRSLWIVTDAGWLHYDPTLDGWDRGFAGGPVLQAGLDRTRPLDGFFMLTRDGWLSATRGSGFATPVQRPPRPTDLIRAAAVEDAARENPQLASLLSGALLAPGLRAARVTAAAEAPDRTGWWIGTDGSGLLFLPQGSMRPEERSWGLPGPVAGGVFAVPGGVWAVTDRTVGTGAALVHVNDAGDDFQWFFGDRVLGQPFGTVRAIHVVDSLIWLGTDQGAFAFTRRGERARVLGERDGLADRRILAIAAQRGRLVLGTAAGIAEVTDSGARRLAPNYVSAAYSVALAGDTTWVGTPLGVFALVPGESDLRQAPGWDALQLLRAPIPALLWRGDTLVALTEHALVWRDPSSGAWTLGPDLGNVLGHPRALADGEKGVWIAGSRGVGFARLRSGVERRLSVGDALPAEAWDLSVEGEWLWVATSKGVVRFHRPAVEP